MAEDPTVQALFLMYECLAKGAAPCCDELRMLRLILGSVLMLWIQTGGVGSGSVPEISEKVLSGKMQGAVE